MNDIVMARTSLFRPPARQPASQPARIRQSNNQFFPSENLVKNDDSSEDVGNRCSGCHPGSERENNKVIQCFVSFV
ncbi:hypothetical protein DPMN_037729 [Dreissena polymorpha]|uniref:Uncharacterized protein n=1 Tax=Dreissena polymorpha TaxID=45954 RepID=A0A9D4RN30_DREPO|nr:hypothetical protein DPMN_037729 [Dreissena polymorpha]